MNMSTDTSYANIFLKQASQYSPEQLAQFRKEHASAFDPKSRVDREKMQAQLSKVPLNAGVAPVAGPAAGSPLSL